MDGKVLAVNTGSGSKKYALYENGRELFRAHLEKEGENFISTIAVGGASEKETISKKDYDSAIENLLSALSEKKLIAARSEIAKVGIRVVAPGNYFAEDKIIDNAYLSEMKKAQNLTPLHLYAIFLEIKELKRALPGAVLAGISDSAFHHTMPDTSHLYGIPRADADKFGIQRFGYHGISAESILPKIRELLGEIPLRTIICHLGSGSSVHALKQGRSIDTSMGFTPLEGLPSGTRVGNIDAGAAVYLAKKLGLNLNEALNYFAHRCGLLGYSGKAADVRELIDLENRGDAGAKLALDSFVYWVQKYIGSYAAALNGLDLLVFTATIGERSPIMRDKICRGMKWLGIELDREKNEKAIDSDGLINNASSPVRVAVIATDEMGEITRHALALGKRNE